MYGSFLRLCLTATMLIAAPALAQEPSAETKRAQALRNTGRIVTQPAQDIGAKKVVIPPVLQQAIAAPYGIKGTATCRQVAAGLSQLNKVLGPDFAAGSQYNEDRASKIAEAGGKTIVNSILPFRGLVREVSGAAPAERRLNAAMDAGYARRGFLRGLQKARGCRA